MSLDAAIYNILEGKEIENQIDDLVNEAINVKAAAKAAGKFLVGSGWKSRIAQLAVLGGISMAGWAAYKRLEKMDNKNILWKIVYAILKEIYSSDTAKEIATGNYRNVSQHVRNVLRKGGPLGSASAVVVSCIEKIVINTLKELPEGETPSDRELRKALNAQMEDEFGHIPAHGGEDKIEKRLKYFDDPRAAMMHLYREGKELYKVDSLLYLIYFRSSGNACSTPRSQGKTINLDGVSPEALHKAFIKYIGLDYHTGKPVNVKKRGKGR